MKTKDSSKKRKRIDDDSEEHVKGKTGMERDSDSLKPGALNDSESDQMLRSKKEKKKQKAQRKLKIVQDSQEVVEEEVNEQTKDKKKKKKKKESSELKTYTEDKDVSVQVKIEKKDKKKNKKKETMEEEDDGSNDKDSEEETERKKIKRDKQKNLKKKQKKQSSESEEDEDSHNRTREGVESPTSQPALVRHSFETTDADHAETPREAYEHILPLLHKMAEAASKKPSELRIYDPFFCTGSMKRHLASLGFTNVYNKNEDFYEMVKSKRIPEHDMVVTNPPYSLDHIPRFLRWLSVNDKPWLLLVPNYVYTKDYFSSSLRGRLPMFLTPPGRYVYESPKHVANAQGQIRKSGEHKTAPYVSFWYVETRPIIQPNQVHTWWMAEKMFDKTNCRLCKNVEQLPANMRDSFDPLRKRLPKHMRKAMKKSHTADGRPLCKQCGQVHGNCKHTRQ